MQQAITYRLQKTLFFYAHLAAAVHTFYSVNLALQISAARDMMTDK
jgi:hypothetical protein